MNERDFPGSDLFDRPYFRTFCAAVAWISLAFIAYATLAPLQQRPHASNSPGLERLMAFAFLGIVFLIAYPRRLSFVCSIVLGNALLLELLQVLTLDRHARLIDAFEKMLGGSLGILAAGVVLRWLKTKGRSGIGRP